MGAHRIHLGPGTKVRPPPCAQAESANFRPFYVKRRALVSRPLQQKRAEISPNPPSSSASCTKKRAGSSQNPTLGWVVGGWSSSSPLLLFNSKPSSDLGKYGKYLKKNKSWQSHLQFFLKLWSHVFDVIIYCQKKLCLWFTWLTQSMWLGFLGKDVAHPLIDKLEMITALWQKCW